MNQLQIFNNAEFGNVRTILIDDVPWFVGKDIAAALGYSNIHDALISHVYDDDKMIIQKSDLTTLEIPNRGLLVINESGLYSLIFSSKLPLAKRFKKWVTSEVLPTLRKTGGYEMDYARELRLKEEADTITSMITSENWKYVEKNITERFSVNSPLLPSYVANLSAKLIVVDEKDKWAIDNAMKAFGKVYEYFRTTHDDIKIKDLINTSGYEWLSTVGTAILYSAQYLGRKSKFAWDSNSPYMFFNCLSLRKDGCVTIPKIGVFATDEKIVIPTGKQLSLAFVKKEQNGSYGITFKCK